MNNKSTRSFSLKKLLLTALVAAPLATLPAPLWALPATQVSLNSTIFAKTTGVTVTLDTPTLLTITSPDRGIITWNDLGTGNLNTGVSSGAMTFLGGDSMNFQLPSAGSAILNRVIGANGTLINGQIISNGSVYVINPNGAVLGATANVNVGGDFAISAIGEPDGVFLATGKLSFIGVASNTVFMGTFPNASVTAAGGSGNVFIGGGAIAISGSIAGNLVVKGTGGTVQLSGTGGGPLTVSGNADIATSGGNLNLSTFANTTIQGSTVAINTVGGTNGSVLSSNLLSAKAVTIVAGSSAAGAPVTVNGTINSVSVIGGNTLINNSGDLSIGASTINGTLGVVSNTGNIANSGPVAVTGAISLQTVAASTGITFSGTGDMTFASLLTNGTGGFAAITTTGNVTVPAALTIPTLNVTTSGGNLTGAATTVNSGTSVVLSSGGTLSGFTAINSPIVTLVAKNDLVVTPIAFGGTNNLTITSTAGKVTETAALATGVFVAINSVGDLSVAAVTTPTFNATSSGGKVTATGTITTSGSATLSGLGNVAVAGVNSAPFSATTGGNFTASGAVVSTGTATINATGAASSVTATNAGNDFSTLNVQAGTGGATVVDVNGLVLGTLNVNGNFTASTGGAITDGVGGAFIYGTVNLTTAAGGVTLNKAGHRFGQFNVASPGQAVVLTEQTTLNLGSIQAATLNATSTGGDLVNTADMTITGASFFGAGSVSAPGNVTVTSPGNVLNGTITIGTAKDLTISTASPTVVNGTGPITGTAFFTVAGGNSFTTSADYNVFGGSFTGGVLVSEIDTLTIRNLSVTGAGNVFISNNLGGSLGGAFVLDSGIAINTTGLTTFRVKGPASPPTSTGAAGIDRANGIITDAADGIFIYGSVLFDTGGGNGITITRAGHSFGPIGIITGNNSAVVLREAGTLNLAGANTTNGAITLTSGGSIIQSVPSAAMIAGGINGGILGNGGDKTISVTAGVNVVLDSPSNNTRGIIQGTAAGNFTFIDNQTSSSNMQIGNLTAGGNVIISRTAIGGSGNSIQQVSGTRILSNGNFTVSFQSAANTLSNGLITLTNTGNNFGAVTIVANTADVKITESNTMNLRSISGGSLIPAVAGSIPAVMTLTSETGDIINSGALKPSLLVTGVDASTVQDPITLLFGTSLRNVSFNTPKGAISVNQFPAAYPNQFTGVALTSAGNASIYSVTPVVLLGGSVVTGNADITTATAPNILAISSAGKVVIAGTVVFNSTNADISLTDNQSTFGQVRFFGRNVTVTENASIRIQGGSFASGNVVFNSFGDIFNNANESGSFIQGTLFLGASGNVTLVPGIAVQGVVTLNASGTKDLSKMSLSGNLNNLAPVNFGTGAYLPPAP